MTNDQTLEHFRVHGWRRVPGAFGAEEAAAMRDAVWSVLGHRGYCRDQPSSWKEERPSHLQGLKDDPVFGAAWSRRTLIAIGEVMEGSAWTAPKSVGALFLAFPTGREWNIPVSGWHIDANYLSALNPPDGVQVHALFGDTLPRAGGTLMVSGSHRLVHKWFKDHPPPAGTRGAEYRERLREHPYLREIHTPGEVEERVARFMDHVEEVDGIPLQVVESAGSAGDVILLHPLTLHVAAPNNGSEPRFLLSGGVVTDAMWRGKPASSNEGS